MSSNVPPRLATLGGILAPDRQRPIAPSHVSPPLPSSQFAGKSASGVRSLTPLGKESLHHETSHNNAGIGRDDVEPDRLLLLVAVVRQPMRWRRLWWRRLRSRRLRSWLRRSGLCPARNDQLSNLRRGDRTAAFDHDGVSASGHRAGSLARPARSAADLPLTLRVSFPKNRGRRSRCVPILRSSTRRERRPRFVLKRSAISSASCSLQRRFSCDRQPVAAPNPGRHPGRSSAGRPAVQCRCSRPRLLPLPRGT